MKKLFIAEKPSVAQQFAEALGVTAKRNDGFIEDNNYVVTWCVGHLVTMEYPDAYDASLKRWSLATIPFVPTEYKYKVIDAVAKQFKIVSGLLTRKDIECIYVCTDSGREGEYIYRLVDMLAGVPSTTEKRRVWIDSQTKEEILRGIKEAKLLSEYDNISDSAYLRAKEDYLMGINFSRALTLKFGPTIRNYLGTDKCVIAVGRVMTCVLGMIVTREREIRDFVPIPFYRVVANFPGFESEFKAVKGSYYFESPLLYKENGFKERETAEALISSLELENSMEFTVEKVEKKKEKKQPPMLYNLAELQNDCSRFFKISPADTLKAVQELYEKKLVTYPRTDARVLSTAVSKEIGKNIKGLSNYAPLKSCCEYILANNRHAGIAKTKYVNDKQITDHYAIIPTGQGFGAYNSLSDLYKKIYDLIARRFAQIFLDPAVYDKVALTLSKDSNNETKEYFFSNFKTLAEEGYLKIAYKPKKATNASKSGNDDTSTEAKTNSEGSVEEDLSEDLNAKLSALKKGDKITADEVVIKEGETSPPKRYNSGSLILAMENAGNFIEDEDLRALIKGSGIGTSATRDAIITKLDTNKYISLNKKTQIVTPTFLGEIIYDVVFYSINALLRAEMTASWEKGLTGVADGSITTEEYTNKMNSFVIAKTNVVKGIKNEWQITSVFDKTKPFYEKKSSKS